jgi:hypothetical protein
VLNGKSHVGFERRRNEKAVKTDPPPKNLPDWVFVVQFRIPTEPGSAPFSGRAEHLMSGESKKFKTSEELVGFFERVTKELKSRSQQDARQ